MEIKIEKSTIIRAILLLIVIVNIVLERCGIDIIPADENTVAMLVETVIEILIIAASYWYNNSFSQKALKAQQFLRKLKEEGKGDINVN